MFALLFSACVTAESFPQDYGDALCDCADPFVTGLPSPPC
jgi:hypothetical protein